jgi:hypothetical protein
MAISKEQLDRILGNQSILDRVLSSNQPTMKAYTPSTFDVINSNIQQKLEQAGLDRYKARDFTEKFLGSNNNIGLADFTPYGIAKGSEYAGNQFFAPAVQDFQQGNIASGLGGTGLGVGAMILGTGKIPTPIKTAAAGAKKAVTEMAERAVATPKAIDAASRFKGGEKAGIYRGSEAFGGITPQKLGSMRSEYLNKMEQGVGGRNWYDESSADINRWVGKNPTQADQLANILAITSAETPVASNLMYANKAWNQYLTGSPLNTGKRPERMGKDILSIMTNPEASASGLKRSPFSAGLSVDWRGKEFASRPTHDIHDVRAWGITDPKTGDYWKKGVGEAGHRFLDEQADYVTQEALKRNLGGVSDWNPYRAQAAAWIAQKAQKEGKPIAETAKHYGTYAPNYQGLLTREWIPANTADHLPELFNASDEIKQLYSQAMESRILNKDKIDNLARSIGALSDTTTPNIGYYEGEFNPAFISRIGVGKSTGSQSIDPASENVMKAAASAHGILGVQKQSAWNYLGGEVPMSQAGGIKLLGKNPSPEKFKEFTAKLQEIGGDVPMYDPEGGLRLLNFVDEDALRKQGLNDVQIAEEVAKQKSAFGKKVKTLAKEYNLNPSFHALSSDIYPFNAPNKWSVKPYLKTIEESGLENATSNAMQQYAGGLLDEQLKQSQALNLTNASWYEPMMKALKEGGLPKLKELVKAGIVPAIALTVAPSIYQQDQSYR